MRKRPLLSLSTISLWQRISLIVWLSSRENLLLQPQQLRMSLCPLHTRYWLHLTFFLDLRPCFLEWTGSWLPLRSRSDATLPTSGQELTSSTVSRIGSKRVRPCFWSVQLKLTILSISHWQLLLPWGVDSEFLVYVITAVGWEMYEKLYEPQCRGSDEISSGRVLRTWGLRIGQHLRECQTEDPRIVLWLYDVFIIHYLRTSQ